MRVALECITMVGSQYAVFERGGRLTFPEGALKPGETPGAAARRIVAEWTGTRDPKLELVDLLSRDDALLLLFRAMLIEEPKPAHTKIARMSLPERVGSLAGKDVEEALKTSLTYKLTRG